LDGRGSLAPVPSHRDPLLGEIVRRLTEVYRPKRIYLFGSTARGDAGPDSDYDLMIVLPDDAPVDKECCSMQPDPIRVEETLAWVKKSRKDLWRAESLLTLDPPDTEDCLFYSPAGG